MHPSLGRRSVLRDGAYRNGAAVGPLLEEPPLPLSDWELWACANQVLTVHGRDAPLHVAEQIGALALAGDHEGVRTWQEIAKRIADLADLKDAPTSRH